MKSVRKLKMGSLLVSILFASFAFGSEDPVAAVAKLKAKVTGKGELKINGTVDVKGKKIPLVTFGSFKIGKDDDKLIDTVRDSINDESKSKKAACTIFVRSGDEFIRATTSVTDAKTKLRCTGTPLDPKGEVQATIMAGNSFTGAAPICGNDYNTYYEPFKDASGKVVGIFLCGFLK